MDEIKGQMMLEQQVQNDGQDDQQEVVIEDQQQDIEIDAEQLPGNESESSEDDAINDEVVVSIGDEQPQEVEKPAPRWVKELRKSQRELARENRELKAKLESAGSTETKPVQLGAKPTLDSCDYDSERYEAELTAWFDRKREHDQAEQIAREAQEVQQREWQAKLSAYAKAKSELKVRDYDEAEDAVQSMFDMTQQGVILEGADNPALLVYALGKSPSKAKELAAIKSPVKFSFAIAKLEKDLKVSTRNKQAPAPEKTVSGTARISGSVDSHLERLRDEAARTGDLSKVMAYKRQLKSKSNLR